MENEKRPLTKFCTGSSYIGEWNQLRMSGKGEYTMSNGIVYRGGMNESQFHGYGMLTYPNGHQIRGHWLNGRVQDMKFIFNDGLVFTEDNWEYCNGTDRRFYFEINNGLPPIGRHNLTSQQRIINLSDGCYDTGGGIYILSKKILVNPETNEIIRYDYIDIVL